jgi:hypothetical protein
MLQLAYNKLALYYLHAQLRMQNYKGWKIQGHLFTFTGLRVFV